MPINSFTTATRRRILLIGATGQVGWELQCTLAPLGDVIAVSRNSCPLALDLADPDSIRTAIQEVQPNLIVNAAAYTAVDKAEEEPKLAMAVNGIAPGVLAEEAKRVRAVIVHYSTDYVFDGTKEGPYTEEDEPNPLNVYGKTKLAGERAIQAVGGTFVIFRASWVYGARGNNFLLTILRLAKERDKLRVVDDQIGTPTWSRMVAEATGQILLRLISPAFPKGEESIGDSVNTNKKPITGISRIYHLTAGGNTSWYGFAKKIIDYAIGPEHRPSVEPIPTKAYPLPALRPANSRLSCEAIAQAFKIQLPDWDVGLRLCLGDIQKNIGIAESP